MSCKYKIPVQQLLSWFDPSFSYLHLSYLSNIPVNPCPAEYGITGYVLNFLDTSCLPESHRQTVQTQIRLLLKKQSDQEYSLFAIQTRIL